MNNFVHAKPHYSGFSLIELSMVLLILGFMIGGIMAALTQDTRITKNNDLKTKMDAIENALSAFVKANNRLPCPADLTLAITSQYFGRETTATTDITTSCIGSTGNYTSGARNTTPSPPIVNFYTSNTVIGTVPVRTLGLPDEYMFDPWGGRFTYAADIRMTTTTDSSTPIAPFVTYASNNATIGGITIISGSGNDAGTGTTITAKAIVTITSHGINGHGAYQLSGARKSIGSTNGYEQQNCNCNATAANGTIDSTFAIQNATTYDSTSTLKNFDDTVRYYTRGNFMTTGDVVTEK